MKPTNSSEYAKITHRTREELQDPNRKLADLARKAVGSVEWKIILDTANENNIHDTDTLGNTALHYACEIDPSTLNPLPQNSNNPLPAAVHAKKTLNLKTIITTLIQKGSRITQKGDGKETPLGILIRKDRLDIIMNVLNKNNVNDMDDCGFRAIDYATQHGNDQIAAYLIENGAKLTQKNGAEFTPLKSMIVNKQLNFIRRVINKNNVNIKDDFNKTLLHYVCELGDLEVFNYLKSIKANSAIQDANGQTPLHIATIENHPTLVAGLCIQPIVTITGANNNNSSNIINIKKIRDNQGFLAVDYAEALKRSEMEKFLRINTKSVLVKASSDPTPNKFIRGILKKPENPITTDKLLQAQSRYSTRERGRSRSFGNDMDAIKAYVQSVTSIPIQANTQQTKNDSSTVSSTSTQAPAESETNPPPTHNPQLGK